MFTEISKLSYSDWKDYVVQFLLFRVDLMLDFNICFPICVSLIFV